MRVAYGRASMAHSARLVFNERDETRLTRICIYCGSSPGANPRYLAAARQLGKTIARDGASLVYGGGDLGLMGEVARAVLAGGGRVTGIIPAFLQQRERVLGEAQELVVVPDMHTRKRLMFERADAFVALPGGIGTLEELVEQLTWAQLGQHTKPIVMVDIDGFWQPLLALLDHMRREGFIRESDNSTPVVVDRVEDVLPIVMRAREAAARSGTAHEALDPRL